MKKVGLLTLFCFMAFHLTILAAVPFTNGNIVVLRIGDGTGALTTAATAGFLDEYTTSGTLVQSIPIRTVASGLDSILTFSGTATGDGSLTLSPNGKYLSFAGYNISPGTASVTGTSGNRTVALVDQTGTMNTSTMVQGYSANNIRGAVTTDGTSFWTSGNATSVGGTRYTTLGSVGTSVRVSATTTNTRCINIFNGQLYTTASANPLYGVCTVGTGLPTTAGQTTALLPGFPAVSGPSPYGFAINSAATVCYVADDRAVASSGGLQKWTLSGGTWALTYTLATNLTSGLRHISVDWSGTNPVIYATTADASSKIVKVTDAGAGALSPFTTLYTTATNTTLRGIAFAPASTPPTVTTTTPSPASSSTATSGGNVTFDGGSSITARGVCYGLGVNPDITGSKTSDGTGTGVFTSNLSGLSQNTLYHVRAYATNSSGTTAYGSDLTFTTWADQNNADFRSRATGNFEDFNSWEYNYTGSSYTNATQSPTSNNNVTVQASHVITMTNDFTINTTKTLTVNGTLISGTHTISGLGTFTLASGSTLKIGSTTGIASSGSTGNIQTSTRNFNAGANYVYNGAAGQVTGSGLPASLTGSLKISNTTAAVTLSQSTAIGVGGTCTIDASAILTTGAFTFASNTGTVTVNGTFQIDQGGWGGNTGTYSYGSNGSLVFNNTTGIYDINGDAAYWPATNGPVNVDIMGAGGININVARSVSGTFVTSAGVNYAGNLTLSGIVQIYAGGYFNVSSPVYSGTPTLIYNTGGDFNVGYEWSTGTSVGAGVPYNVTIQTTKLSMTTSDRTCPGNLSIASGGTLVLNGTSGDLYVKLNWSNSGIFTHNNRKVILNGTYLQTITGINTFYDFEINNAAGVNLGTGYLVKKNNSILGSTGTCTVNNSFILTNGLISTSSANVLTLGATCVVSGGSSSSFVNGPITVIARTTVPMVAPIGKGSVYRPMTSTLNIASGSGAFTIELLAVPPTGAIVPTKVAALSQLRYYHVVQTGDIVGNANMTLTWGSDDGVVDPAKMTIVAGTNGVQWIAENNYGGHTGDVTAGTISTNYQTSGMTNGDFTLGFYATQYYSTAAGDLNLLSTWGTSTNGTGTNPTDFSLPYQTFNIRNRSTATISGNVTLGIIGTKIKVGDGASACNFTIPGGFSVTGKVDVSGNATLTLQNTVIPTLGTLSGTVVFAGSSAQTIPGVTFFNLTINNASGVVVGANCFVNGVLTLTNGLVTTTASQILTLGSSATVSGGSNSSFINGPVTVTGRNTIPMVAPVGKGSAYRPMISVLNITSGSGTFTCEQFETTPTGTILSAISSKVKSLSPVRYFHISQTGDIVGTASITLTWGSDDGVVNPLKMSVVAGTNGVQWIAENNSGGYTGNSTSGTVSTDYNSSGLTSGDFCLGFYTNSLNLTLTAFLQGNTNPGGTAMSSLNPISVNVELHNATAPYALVESRSGTLNASGIGSFTFTSAADGTPYFIVVKSPNTVETWSAAGQSFASDVLSYNFTTSNTKAYGSNMIQIGSAWCIYSGDVNGDGSVDAIDLNAIYNDVNAFAGGVLTTDLNGDQVVDAIDLNIVYNNNNAFVGRVVPSGYTGKSVTSHFMIQGTNKVNTKILNNNK